MLRIFFILAFLSTSISALFARGMDGLPTSNEQTKSHTKVARRILALYDGSDESSPASTRIHRWLETPLNHLGYVLTYRDVSQDLPSIQNQSDYAGVTTWFSHPLQNEAPYAKWAAAVVRSGKKSIILGDIGVGYWSPSFRDFEGVLTAIGLRHTHRYVDLTHGTSIIRSTSQNEHYDPVVPSYPVIEAADPRLNILLELRTPPREGSRSAVAVATGAGGGYAASGFEIAYEPLLDRTTWLFDPLSFLVAALETETWPRPDVTTAFGRRIFYAEVCADLALFEIEEGKPRSLSTALLDELGIVEHQTPITIIPPSDRLAREEDQEAFREELRRLGNRPNIEVALSFGEIMEQTRPNQNATNNVSQVALNKPVGRPRIDLHDIDIARVRLLQLPYDGSLTKADFTQIDRMDLKPIGEGYSRAAYLTLADIAPLSTPYGQRRRFDIGPIGGCEPTPHKRAAPPEIPTIRAALAFPGPPARLRPVSIAFHLSSLADHESIDAIRQLFKEARDSSVFHMHTTDYVDILRDFENVAITRIERGAWLVSSRGHVETVRFDRSMFDVDLTRSRGVTGRRMEGETLFVALDSAVSDPIIVTQEKDTTEETVGLSNASWQVSELSRQACGWTYTAAGFGPGEFQWYGVKNGSYNITAARNGSPVWSTKAHADAKGQLAYVTPAIGNTPLSVNVGCDNAQTK